MPRTKSFDPFPLYGGVHTDQRGGCALRVYVSMSVCWALKVLVGVGLSGMAKAYVPRAVYVLGGIPLTLTRRMVFSLPSTHNTPPYKGRGEVARA